MMISSIALEFLVLFLLHSSFSTAERYPCNRTRSCGCGSADVDINSRIIKGESAIPYSWSMMVSIRLNFSSNGSPVTHVCGGTLLSDSYILTSAHCFESISNDLQSTDVTIAAALHRRSQRRQIIRKVDQIILHPNWTSSWLGYEHDIALLHLSEPLDFSTINRRVSKTCLPSKVATLEDLLMYPNSNERLVVVGWGRLSFLSEDSDMLQQISVRLVDHNAIKCSAIISDPKRQFCAGSSNSSSGPCYGDFGGPIFRWNDDYWEQIGIISFTSDGCKGGAPIVYTRVAYYHDWIQSYLNQPVRQFNDTTTAKTPSISTTTEVTSNVYECDRESVSCGCGLRDVEFQEARILNSEEAKPYSWSMVVSIRFNGSTKHECGGSVLNQSYVLTSASCIANAPILGITVVGGLHSYSELSLSIRKVASIFIHPDYSGEDTNYVNDIAVLHLAQPFDFDYDPYLSRTCIVQMMSFLQKPIFYPSLGDRLAVIGWGYTNYENRTDPEVLHQVEVLVENHTDDNCPIEDGHEDLQFCAGVEDMKKIPCIGDSGSPIFQWYGTYWEQVGLVSSVSQCSETKSLGLYTRLVIYYDWILSITTGFSSVSPTTTTTTATTTRGRPGGDKPPVFYQCDRNSSCGCGSVPVLQTPSRIVGGEEALQYSWPMTVSLRSAYDADEHMCGATIVSNSYILTAAHCLPGYTTGPVDDLMIAAGMTNLLDSKQVRRSVDRVYKHPNYTNEWGNFRHDIALLHLNQSLPTEASAFLTKTCINPAEHPLFNSQYIKNGSRLTVIGWGTTTSGASETPENLRQVEVFAIDNDHPQCQESIQDPELQFCAGLYEGGKDSCQGDSGGPIFQWTGKYWEQVGVVSYGRGCARPGYPGIYTRLSYYYDWINEILSNDNEHIEPATPTNRTTTRASTTITASTTRQTPSKTSTLQSSGNNHFEQYYLVTLLISMVPIFIMSIRP